jgi:hypothetical protein
LPDNKYGSNHPRDVMSVGAVLAHEYYGHRYYRDEYLLDIEKGDDIFTTPYWEDECRASITAAKITPNLTDLDVSNLIQDAVFRAKETGNLIEMDDFMKEAVYGYTDGEKTLLEKSHQSDMLTSTAVRELYQYQKTSVKCPKCGGIPRLLTTSNGERTIVKCSCRYIYNMEINF